MAEFSVLAPGDAGVSGVSSLRLSLLTAMDKAGSGDSIVLDLGRLASADSSLAQLILAFRLEAGLRGQKALVAGEDSKMSVSALLGCDAVCETCAFNDFKARAKASSGSGQEAAQAGPQPGTKAGKA